jgi:murein DD-endopeptidase MepM/ murein hydrolase activator NlpD
MSQKLSQFGFGAFAALAFASSAAPAFANSSASADIAAPLRAASAAKSGAEAGDAEFRQLFSSWQALDNGIVLPAPSAASLATGTTARRSTVSIPSMMPVATTRLSSGYGMRVHPVLGGRRAHKGIDLPAATGTPIRATADGTVGMADWFGGYGLYVQLEHGGNLETRYGHMSRIAVASGQTVRKGDVIGYVGSTGRSTGPHLHYEVRVNGEAVNPMPYMQTPAPGAAFNEAFADNSSLDGKGGPE